jgi:PAS domain S-box-containing protein
LDSHFVTAAATDDQALKKRFIRIACFVVIGGCLAYLAMAPWLAGQLPMHFIAPALFLLVCLSALALHDRLGTQATGLLISYGMCAGSLLAGTLSGTVRTTSIYSLIVVIGMAGWLAGPRHALQVAALSIAGTLGITLAGQSGLLPDTSPPRPYAIWLGLTILLTIAAILSRIVTLAFQAQLARVESLSQILARQVREIRADETQLRLLAENMPAMIIHVRQQRCLYANAQYAAFVGKTQKDIAGLHIRELIGESAYADISPYLERAEAGERVVYRRIAQRPDGKELAIEVSLVPERDEGGKVIGFIGLVQDITEQLQRETALRLSEDKLSKVFSASPLAIAITRLSDGRYLEVNEAWCRLHGWSHEEAIGKTSLELGTWHDPKQREAWRRSMLEKGRVSNLDVVFRVKDGTLREALLSSEPIELAGERCALVMTSDITERRQAERALNESEALLRIAVQGGNIGLWEWDIATDNLRWNDRLKAIFGLPPDAPDLTLPFFLATIHAEDLEETQRAFMAALADNAEFDHEYRIVRPDGSVHWIVARGHAQYDADGTPLRMTGAALDITERKQAEAAQRESQERFAKIFEASPITILITRLDTGRYLDVNESFARQFGWQRREVVGRTSLDIGIWPSPGERERWVDELRRQGTLRDYEVGLLTRSGELRHTIVTAETIEIDGVPCIISLIHDITDRKMAEDALRRSEMRFALMFRSSPEAVTISSEADGRYLEVNDAFTALFGWSREEAVGRTALELGLWDNQHDRTRWVRALKPGETVRDFEAVFRRKDGELRSVLVSAGLIELSGERWILSFCYDITGRKRTEEALRRSEDKFSSVFQSSPIAISLARLTDGAFLDANPAFTRMFGWSREEMIGRTSTGIGVWPIAEERERWVAALLAAGRTRDLVVNWRNKSGESRICQISAEVIQLGGEPCILAMTSDITDRVHAEEALKTSQARLTEAQRIGHIGSWELDLTTMRFSWTDELFKIYECDPATFAGTWDDLLKMVHPDDAAVIHTGFRESAKGTGTYELDHRIITPSGRVKHLHVSWEVFFDDGGKPVRALGTAQDVTEQTLARAEIQRLNAELEKRVQERTAELTAANRELESFAYSISHDLRAPLRGIDGFSKLLADEYRERLDEQGIDYLDRVRRAAQRMGTLIDDILELSRVTRQEMRRVRVDLSQIAAEVIDERARAEPAHRVAVSIAPDCTAHGDPQLLRVLMQNLLENAWKYSAKQPAPAIEFGRETIDGEPVFFVRDNGVGFDMKYADRLFSPFQRLHKPEEFEGTGIGLATVARIVRRHGGRVWIEAATGKGTTARFSLVDTPDKQSKP